MYNPYSEQATSSTADVFPKTHANPRIQHPQPQHPQLIPGVAQYPQQQNSFSGASSYGVGNAGVAPGVPTGSMPQQQQQQQPMGSIQGAPFNNIFNDPRANLGFQVGQSAIQHGQQMMQNNLKPYIGLASDLKNLFKVSNQYVLKKMLLILFPFKHSSWSRLISSNPHAAVSGRSESFELPINDINSPDLYIPLMSFITYILFCAIFQGLKGEFHPQLFGYTSSIVFGYQLLDFLVLKLGLYLLNVESSFWDLISYSNYKFIPLVVSLVADNFLRSGAKTTASSNNNSNHPLIYWILFSYLDFSFAFFLMRSLKQVFLGNGVNNTTQTVTQKQRQKRIYFLFGYSFPFQMLLMWLLL